MPVKVRLKKNPEAGKLDGNRKGIKFPIDYRRVFFLIAVFFRGALLLANSRYLPPPYSFYNGRNGRKRLTLTGGHDEQNKNIGKCYYKLEFWSRTDL